MEFGIEQIASLSKTLLNSKYPNDFELYMCSLELVSVKTGKTLMYFIFPIMPESIDFPSTNITNIQNTNGGVSVLKTTNFIPFPINLNGTFGKKFKTTLGSKTFDLVSSFVSKSGLFEKISSVSNEFKSNLKSGYGSCKMLESIVEESNKLDEDGQRVLYFYNLSFNQKYVVEPITLNFKQDLQRNMVWSYSLNLKAVAPLTLVRPLNQQSQKSLERSLSADNLVNNVVSKTLGLIRGLL